MFGSKTFEINAVSQFMRLKVKKKEVTVKLSLDRSLGFQEAVVPGFTDSRHMKVVRSFLGNIPGTHFC